MCVLGQGPECENVSLYVCLRHACGGSGDKSTMSSKLAMKRRARAKVAICAGIPDLGRKVHKARLVQRTDDVKCN